MSTFAITYDLSKPGRNYEALYEEIKGLGAWWHHLESTWLVDTTSTASQIRDRLRKRIDDNDKLLVVATGDGWATAGLSKRANDWIREHL